MKNKPLRDYAPDKFYLFDYGPLDKTIIQTKTVSILLSFMKDVKTDDTKWKSMRDGVIDYWDMCTELSRERKLQSVSNAQGVKNDDNTED